MSEFKAWSSGEPGRPASLPCSRPTMRSRDMYRVWMLSLLSAACASAPAYRAPEVPVPQVFRETRDTVFQLPDTGAVVADTGTWQNVGDSTLSRLIKEAVRANLDVRAAEARVRGARSART